MFVKTEIEKALEVNNYYLSRSEVQHEKVQPQGLNLPSWTLYLSPISLLFSWMIFFLLLRKIHSFIENKMVFNVKNSHQVPCKNCRFYCNNHYLKCAVQPSIVMTDEAKNCSEFSPKKDKEKQFFRMKD
ncbi:hypothetical protein IQ259_19900 [Fortiea sp. LEGE XX443]|uniref:hypothetical protein n=1 Tax=Fortiea sp. LEGE XX443 TaxID=1828611 RepID=UPI001880F1F5|nr:hypothetical protein [Fortiea sp. LEGE XX443]MBE9007268.1 hypothetical protein [Fortiea sp. LEGE XX443]